MADDQTFRLILVFGMAAFLPVALYHRIRSLGVGRIKNDCHFLLHPDVIADEKAMARFESAVRACAFGNPGVLWPWFCGLPHFPGLHWP